MTSAIFGPKLRFLVQKGCNLKWPLLFTGYFKINEINFKWCQILARKNKHSKSYDILKLHSFCKNNFALKNTVWRHLTKLSLMLIYACYWPEIFGKPSKLNKVHWKIVTGRFWQGKIYPPPWRIQLKKFREKQKSGAIQRRLRNFFCNCNQEHRYFILTYKYHPFVEVSYRDDKCRCKILSDQKDCDFCKNIEDIFNYKAAKVCVK